MKNIMTIIFSIFLLNSISFSQQINIHTSSGTDVYNFADIDSITFTISDDTSTTGTVMDIDGNVYQTIKIGNQWWMAENFKVTHYRNGDVIPNVTDDSEWAGLTTGALCSYDNHAGHIDTYGLLYNWYTVIDNRNLAPEGWHVSTDDDWKELEMYLGMSQLEADDTGWRGTDEGGKLKEAGTTSHWSSPNTGATNETGFTALPGGYCYSDGSFKRLTFSAHIWSPMEGDSDNEWRRHLYYSESGVTRSIAGTKNIGFMVRCVKD